MSKNERKQIEAALQALQLWFIALPYGYSEASPANAAAVALRTQVRDRMIEQLAK